MDTRSGFRKALEQQVVLQRVQIGDLERVGHQRAGPRTPARPHRTAVVLGPLDEVTHDQEVARKTHLEDGAQLELQAFNVARALLVAHDRIRVQVRQPFLQPVERCHPEILLDGHATGRRKIGELRLSQDQRQVAALRDLAGVGDGRRHIGKQCLHLRGRLEILLTREAAHATRVAQDFSFSDAHPGLVRFVVLGSRKLHRMGGHHRQVQAGRQLHRRHHMGLVVGAPGALDFHIEPVREHPGQPQRKVGGPSLVTP
jgi:hypothetical protein